MGLTVLDSQQPHLTAAVGVTRQLTGNVDSLFGKFPIKVLKLT